MKKHPEATSALADVLAVVRLDGLLHQNPIVLVVLLILLVITVVVMSLALAACCMAPRKARQAAAAHKKDDLGRGPADLRLQALDSLALLQMFDGDAFANIQHFFPCVTLVVLLLFISSAAYKKRSKEEWEDAAKSASSLDPKVWPNTLRPQHKEKPLNHTCVPTCRFELRLRRATLPW